MARLVAAVAIAATVLATHAGAASYRGLAVAGWSPDGTRIAFVRHVVGTASTNELVVVNANRGGQRVVYESSDGCCSGPVEWASNRLLVLDDDYKVETVDLAAQPKVRDTGLGFSGFAVSPNGRTVAGWAEEPDFPQAIGVASITGAGLRTLPRPSPKVDESNPSFSPDGTRIVFERRLPTSGCCRVTRLVVQSVKGGAARPLRVVGFTPQWSPDGRWIAFVTPNGHEEQLEIVAAAGGRPQILAVAAVGSIEFSWAPDSKRLLYGNDSEQSLGIVDLAGHMRPLDVGRLVVVGAAFWSPDGRRIAFTGLSATGSDRRTAIYVIGVDGHGLRRVA